MIRVVDAAGNLLAGPEDKRVCHIIARVAPGDWLGDVALTALDAFCRHPPQYLGPRLGMSGSPVLAQCCVCGTRVERIAPP